MNPIGESASKARLFVPYVALCGPRIIAHVEQEGV